MEVTLYSLFLMIYMLITLEFSAFPVYHKKRLQYLFYDSLNAKHLLLTDGKRHKVRELDMITLKKLCTAFIHDMITRDFECC